MMVRRVSQPSKACAARGLMPTALGLMPSRVPEMQVQFLFTIVYGQAALPLQRFRGNVRPD